MKATWNGTTIAEAEQNDLIRIEGNWYFPPNSIKKEYFKDSELQTECFWKGTASYYDVEVDGEVSDGGAFYYPEPKAGSTDKVGKNFANYVSFWRGIQVA